MREEFVSEQLGELLKNIYVPEGIAHKIVESLQASHEQTEKQWREQAVAAQQRLSTLRTRMDQIYEDKLDSKISDALWERKQAEYREQELALETSLAGLSSPMKQDGVLTAERVFELANKAYSLYLTRNTAETRYRRSAPRYSWRFRTTSQPGLPANCVAVRTSRS